MMMDRDKEIIDFIHKVGYASIKNIADMYFTNSRYNYDSARKRLKKIENLGKYIKSFRNEETNERIYVPLESKTKRVTTHNLKVIEYICKLKCLGCNVILTEIEPIFNNTKPDAYVVFKFNDFTYTQLIEIQIRHDYVDLKRFKNHDTINEILDKNKKTLNTDKNLLPKLVIIQNTNRDYTKENDTPFNIVQMSVAMEDMAKVLM